MTRPADPNRYPTYFSDALDLAISKGEFRIPSQKPASLRGHLYGYLQALRNSGQREKADAVILQIEAGALIIRLRDNTTVAAEIKKALEAEGETGGIKSKFF